jgi:hypothetical protein
VESFHGRAIAEQQAIKAYRPIETATSYVALCATPTEVLDWGLAKDRAYRIAGGLSCPVTRLNLNRRLRHIFFVYPAKALFEQLKACVLVINKHTRNQAPVTINCLRPQFYIFTEHQFAHGLIGALAERLALSGASIKAMRTLIC